MGIEVRRGRPRLTERRKEQTRLDIAREAVRLFTAQGVSATSVAEIAAAADVSVRTLWRYFATKESCVAPLLTTGVEVVAARLRDVSPTAALDELLDSETAFTREDDLADVLALVRLTRHESALRGEWLRAHRDAEPAFADSLAERLGASPQDLAVKIRAATINAALRVAVEDYAERVSSRTPRRDEFDTLLREAWRVAAAGFDS